MAIVFVRSKGGKLKQVGETQERTSGFSDDAYAQSREAQRIDDIATVRDRFLGSGLQISRSLRVTGRHSKYRNRF